MSPNQLLPRLALWDRVHVLDDQILTLPTAQSQHGVGYPGWGSRVQVNVSPPAFAPTAWRSGSPWPAPGRPAAVGRIGRSSLPWWAGIGTVASGRGSGSNRPSVSTSPRHLGISLFIARPLGEEAADWGLLRGRHPARHLGEDELSHFEVARHPGSDPSGAPIAALQAGGKTHPRSRTDRSIQGTPTDLSDKDHANTRFTWNLHQCPFAWNSPLSVSRGTVEGGRTV